MLLHLELGEAAFINGSVLDEVIGDKLVKRRGVSMQVWKDIVNDRALDAASQKF